MEGSNLIKGVDAGGVRWFLDDEPVHAGTGLEILLELEPKYAPEGQLLDFKPMWIPVRLEFEFDTGKALVFWPTSGMDELRSEVLPAARFRWPKK